MNKLGARQRAEAKTVEIEGLREKEGGEILQKKRMGENRHELIFTGGGEREKSANKNR